MRESSFVIPPLIIIEFLNVHKGYSIKEICLALKLNRSSYPDAKPIFHSDRGFQYTNKVFHQKLVDAGMIQSMSRVGRCLDNAPIEGWCGILKSEMYYLKKFTSRDSLVSAIEDYIHFYNTRRYQKRLNCMTPCEYYLSTAT